jgi:hypothetical protein
MWNLLKSVWEMFYLFQSTITYVKPLNTLVVNTEHGLNLLQLAFKLLSNLSHGLMLMFQLSKLCINLLEAQEHLDLEMVVPIQLLKTILLLIQ